VLAGGHSRRFGADKAAQAVAGRSLLERTASLLASCGLPVQVAVRQDQLADPLRARFVLLADRPGLAGPLAGLLAAHAQLPAAAWLLLGCDMPRLDVAVLQQLIAARDPALAATAYLSATDGRPEPLCAIYEPATLARLHEQAGPRTSLRLLLEHSACRLLDPPAGNVLASADTPAALARLTAVPPGTGTGH